MLSVKMSNNETLSWGINSVIIFHKAEIEIDYRNLFLFKKKLNSPSFPISFEFSLFLEGLNEMGFLSSLWGIIGFGLGIPFGLLVGYFFFIFTEPADIQFKEPTGKSLHDIYINNLEDLLTQLPLWVKNSDYDRVDWLNRFISDMWPYLDKAICGLIRSSVKPIFEEYIGNFQVKSFDFERLTLGTLPPTIHGVKFCETNEKELVLEPVVRWAGNADITLAVKLLFLKVAVKVVDLQIFAMPRITLRPFVPTFPCFATVVVSLMEKPRVDFGMKFLGCDFMAIPGLHQFVQESIRKQIASLYLWPQYLEIPILDCSTGAIKKPVGILHVKVLRAQGLLKMDFLGLSDPYVELSLSGERLLAKKTSVKMKNLNPEWNEHFKLIVKDPELQALQLCVYDWDKIGEHDELGMQVVPLSTLIPQEAQSFLLELQKNMDHNDPQNKRCRGTIEVELMFKPFKKDINRYSGPLNGYARQNSGVRNTMEDMLSDGAGLLLVAVNGATDVEGRYHNNPFALVQFRGEERKTKMIRKTRDPHWNEEFQFMLDESPSSEKIHIEVMTKRTGFSFRRKESLGHVDINLMDVIYNRRLNHKYHLINSKNGVIHVDIRWQTI